VNNQLLSLLKQPIRILNHANEQHIFSKPNNPLASFAIDDAIAQTVSLQKAPTTFRIWVHDKTVVLGIPDGRLPYLQDGLSYLDSVGYEAIIRNSGGLAVALDRQVVNLSIVLPDATHLSINEAYDLMYALIQHIFKDKTDLIEAYEIVGSYCPGDYDLSIGGIKFAGISQRRVRNGVAVQIYLDIAGLGQKRAEIVQQFYQVSRKGEQTTYEYPDVNPNVMGSINELLGTHFTAEQFITHLIDQLSEHSNQITHSLLIEEEDIFNKRYDQMIKRNENVYDVVDT